MRAIAAMMLIPPPVPPAPWQPERFPEYEGTCHAVDKRGNRFVGTIKVIGQGAARQMTLKLEFGAALETTFDGTSLAVIGNPVTNGTYSFTEYLAPDDNSQPFGVELQSLGPRPNTMVLTIRGQPNSPVFAEPSEVGLCTTTRVNEGSRFVPGASSSEQPQ